MRDFSIRCKKGSQFPKESGTEDDFRLFGPNVVLVEKGSQDNETVALALILLFDNTVVWESPVRALLDVHIHQFMRPRDVRILDVMP